MIGSETLLLELFNLLINPESHDFALRWHRDDIREDATPEEELKALNIWYYGVGCIFLWSQSISKLQFAANLQVQWNT